MLIKHYEQYLAREFELAEHVNDIINGEKAVREGSLLSRENGSKYRIKQYIPRFTAFGNYAESFGLQWNRFKKTQFDSHTGKPLTAERFWSNTKWHPKEMRNKRLLEVGSGAGRFTEVLLQIDGLEIVSFDYSNSVDANYESNKNKQLFLFQGDLYNTPLEKESFDYVFCYGVLQHTPSPERSFYSIIEYLKPGGLFSVDIYRKMSTPAPWYFPKYFWRPVTTRLKPATLLKIVELYIPVWLPIDTVIKKIPYLGFFLSGMLPIPCWNYLDRGFTSKQRLEWAIMDTFDALAPEYDIPKTKRDIERWCTKLFLDEVEIFFGSNGIVTNGKKVQQVSD